MSQEKEYLTGKSKEKALEIVKKCMAFRFTNEESLQFLKDHGITTSERNLRRFKQEIRDSSGNTMKEVLKTHLASSIIEDILSYEQMQKQSWKVFNDSKTPHDKLKALNTLRMASLEKYKFFKS